MSLPILPASGASTAADAVCRRFADAALTNHSVRSYLWAARYASDNGLHYDAELLYVAAMVHDLGLTAAFDAYRTPFEVVGGELGWVLGVGVGWSPERAQRVTDIATWHMGADVGPDVDVEAHLLQVGTSADVSGTRVDAFAPGFRDELFATYPRLSFDDDFVTALTHEARRKPTSSSALAMEAGLAQRVAGNGLPRPAQDQHLR
jgi:hypothetical protein